MTGCDVCSGYPGTPENPPARGSWQVNSAFFLMREYYKKLQQRHDRLRPSDLSAVHERVFHRVLTALAQTRKCSFVRCWSRKKRRHARARRCAVILPLRLGQVEPGEFRAQHAGQSDCSQCRGPIVVASPWQTAARAAFGQQSGQALLMLTLGHRQLPTLLRH